jgi:DNA-binding transcriptional ArsR family regulator
MARYIKHKFDENTTRIASLSNAMSHPARVEILKIIFQKQTCTCGEVVNSLPYSQSTISQHLNELKIAGLVNSKNINTATMYSINQDGIDEYVYRFTTMIKSIQ